MPLTDDQAEHIARWEPPPPLPAIPSAWTEAAPMKLGFITRRLLRRFVEASIPTEGSGAPAGPDTVERVIDGIERILPYFLPTTAWGFRAGLVALEWLVIPLAPSWRPFSFWPQVKRRALMDRWLEGRSNFKRNFIRAIYLSVCAVYYSLPDVWERLDYQPERWFADRRQRRQEIMSEHGPSME